MRESRGIGIPIGIWAQRNRLCLTQNDQQNDIHVRYFMQKWKCLWHTHGIFMLFHFIHISLHWITQLCLLFLLYLQALSQKASWEKSSQWNSKKTKNVGSWCLSTWLGLWSSCEQPSDSILSCFCMIYSLTTLPFARQGHFHHSCGSMKRPSQVFFT